jgi:D-cysteine desulfhydrase family pyridoxal phosphate-dependent enzyme
LPGTDLLSSFPRFALGHFPTPIERCERLDARADVWLKRDDCTGLSLGGNKTRKLEFLLGKALADGARRVITFGALQSNHARQTAAACAKAGLACDLILTRAVPRDDETYLRSGNVLLDELLGATVHVVDDPDEAATRFGDLADETTFTVVPGGSDATGTLGYVNAAFEIAAQGPAFDRIVVAASTGGTAAGLILGTALAGLDAIVDVVCVYRPADETGSRIRAVQASTAAALGVDVPDGDRWTITDRMLGDGYGIPTTEGLAAIDRLARAEGVLLDPVYTSKAFAFLLDDPRFDGQRVLFIHTGGAPALFAYAG